MKGRSLAHVSGDDRPAPAHVPYGEPKPKQRGLDWSTMRPRFEGDPEHGERVCWQCKAPADSPDRGQCQRHYDEARAADPHRQAAPSVPTSTPEVPMPTITAPERDALEVTTYVADMAGVLSRTEGHPDRLVRDLRKLAVQAIQALSTATAPTNVSALASRATPTPPGGASSPKAGADTPAAEVRAWARETGLDCPKFGRVPDSIREAFAAAQGGAA